MQEFNTRLFLLVIATLLVASPSTDLLVSAQAPAALCQPSAKAAAAAQSGNVSTNATVWAFPVGSPYDVPVTVTRLRGVGMIFEEEGAVIDPQAGTSKTSLINLLILAQIFIEDEG